MLQPPYESATRTLQHEPCFGQLSSSTTGNVQLMASVMHVEHRDDGRPPEAPREKKSNLIHHLRHKACLRAILPFSTTKEICLRMGRQPLSERLGGLLCEHMQRNIHYKQLALARRLAAKGKVE